MPRAFALLLALGLIAHSHGALGQAGGNKRSSNRATTEFLRQSKSDANAGTVTIVTQRTPGGPLMTAALDLSTLLDDGEHFEKMRILPVVARGEVQNLWDMLYLDGVDFAFLQTDTLEYLKDDPHIAAVRDKVRYIAVLFPEEVHVIARAEINSLSDLAGKTVSINTKDSGAAVTAPVIFKRLGVQAILEHEDTTTALERLRTGDLAAHVILAARPARTIADIRGSGLHLLPVPFTGEFEQLYLPAKLSSSEYPNLIPAGRNVETISVGHILAGFNWSRNSERYKKVARFIEAFFSRFSELQKPGFSPKWKEVNLASQAPGWTRFRPAQDWLDRKAELEKSTGEKFKAYAREQGAAPGTPSEDELFQQFLQWVKTRNSQRQPAEASLAERPTSALRTEPTATTTQKPKIRLLVTGRPPLADRAESDGGLVTALVRSSLVEGERAEAQQPDIGLHWSEVTEPQVESLLSDDSVDLSFPWEGVDCKRTSDLGHAAGLLCENALFSDPIIQVVIGVFTLTDSTFKFDTDESLFGKTVCFPQNRDMTGLSGIGRDLVLSKRIVELRQPTIADCTSAVRRGEADAFVASDLEGRYELGRLGLRPLIRMADRPFGMLGIHAIASKRNPQASASVDALNRGLAQLKQSEAYSTIVRQHLMQVWQSPGGAR